MDLFFDILLTLLVFSFLVAFHEWGHMRLALWSGIKVEVFSIGFGRGFSFTWRGVLYKIGWIPAGGYCKMKGHDDFGSLQDKSLVIDPDSYFGRPAWARLLAVSGGPLANLFLGAFLFVILFGMIGVRTSDDLVITSSQSHHSHYERLRAASFAEIPSIRDTPYPFENGDRVVRINGEEVRTVFEFRNLFLMPSLGDVAILDVERDGTVLEGLPYPVSISSIKNPLFNFNHRQHPYIMRNPQSPHDKGKSSIIPQPQSGDLLLAIDGIDVVTSADARRVYRERISGGRIIPVDIERDGTIMEVGIRPQKEKLVVSRIVEPGVIGEGPSPAEIAGFQPGDRILLAGGQAVHSYQGLVSRITSNAGTPLSIFVERDGGEPIELVVEAAVFDGRARIGLEFEPIIQQIGFVDRPLDEALRSNTRYYSHGIFQTVVDGVSYAYTTLVIQISALSRLIGGDEPDESFQENLSGPVAIIGFILESARSRQVDSIIMFAAFLSIMLGFANMLPIPALDGGHIVANSYELISGKSIPLRFMQIMQQVGVIFLLLLIAFTVVNDLVLKDSSVFG